MDEGRCPKCGYTKRDCQIHGDHHLCDGPGPPGWKKPKGKEIADLKAEVERLRGLVDTLCQAAHIVDHRAHAYFDEWGANHEDPDCPQDDICSCIGMQLGDALVLLRKRAEDARAALEEK